MKLVFDIEATGAQRNKAHPFDHRNVACNLGIKNLDTGETKIWKLQYDDEPYGQAIKEIQEWFYKSSVVIGFNIKFDINWLSRYNLYIPDNTRVFDCQLAYYILTNQKNQYPSLNGVSEYYKVEQKLDVVKVEYWDKYLDTDDVPYEILSEYLEQDLNVTGLVYEKIQEDLKNSSVNMQKLISISMQDLVVLADMEKNGLLLNLNKSINKGNEIVNKISEVDIWLRRIFNADWFNPNSGDHLSIFLYGGTVQLDGKENYVFTYKDGRTAEKQRNIKIPFVSQGMFKPLEKTELAKAGFYATNEGTLTALSQKAKGEYKKILDVILKRAKLEKRRSTYYHGYPKHIEHMGWRDNIIHTNYNQCVAVSGRLSSTKPNVQNIEDQVKEIFISRY